MKFSLTIGIIFVSLCCFAQQPQDERAQEKKFRENLEKEIDRLTETLKLEDWQIFYADSVLTANFKGMQEELTEMSNAKVSNSDLYTYTADKWMEKTYDAFRKFLNDEQWAKYLKSGAAKEKKARDKRKEKMSK